jgi:hypothetical protein
LSEEEKTMAETVMTALDKAVVHTLAQLDGASLLMWGGNAPRA